MELFVNNEKIDITLQGEKTISDVLKAFETEAAKNDATTIGIKINGNQVPAESFEEETSKPVEENTKIELRVISKSNVIDSLKNSGKILEDVVKQLPEVPVLLQSGKDKDANEIITKLADSIDAFCHSVTLAALFPEVYTSIKVDDKEMGAYFEEFAPIFQDFEQSLADKDTVTSGDLCEYEIAPRLEKIAQSINCL